MSFQSPSLWIPLLVGGVTWLLFILLVWGLAHLLVRAWRGLRTSFGSTVLARLAGAGIAAVAFPTVVPSLWLSLARLLEQTLVAIPMKTALLLLQSEDKRAASTSFVLGNVLQNASTAISSLANIPVQKVLLFGALWMLAGNALGIPADTTGAGRIRDALKRLKPAQLKNAALYSLLGLGLYLGLAAISAVPSLIPQPDQTPSEHTADRLKGEAMNKLLTQARLDRDYPLSEAEQLPVVPETLQGRPAIATTFVASSTGVDGGGPPDESPASGPVESDRLPIDPNLARQLSQDSASRYADLRRDVVARHARALTVAVERFNLDNALKTGKVERIEHYRRLLQWFGELGTQYENALNACRSNIRVALRIVAVARPMIRQGFAERFHACQIDDDNAEEHPPARPDAGWNLGVLGFVAGWLINLESMPIALIVGMLGFGLLGAAASTFIRERRDGTAEAGGDKAGKSEKALVEDLPGMVIRGFSATIVVFLAVHGGLGLASVAGTGAAQPVNPYTLFLTCLIAAVFSDNVWSWAKARIASFGAPSGGESGRSAGGGKAGSPAGKAPSPTQTTSGAAAPGPSDADAGTGEEPKS